MKHRLHDWNAAYAGRLLLEVRVMEDALGRARDDVHTLFDDYCKLRRETSYCRQGFKTQLEKYGLPPDQAGRLADWLDEWFDALQKELVLVIAARNPPP